MFAQKNMAPTGCLTQFPVVRENFNPNFRISKTIFYRACPMRQLLHKHRRKNVP